MPREKLGNGFGWLNVTQFLGALNDNVFKLLLIMFLIGLGRSGSPSSITAFAGGIFVVPFLLFTALSGKLADRFSKRNIVVFVKFAEAVVMSIGCGAFFFQSEVGLYIVLFLMAAQSAFFAPAKYGIVPELVARSQLSRANGFLAAMTYLAIVTGTAGAAFLAQITGGRFVLMGVICVGIAGLGVATSIKIPVTAAVGAVRPWSVFFVGDIWRTLRGIRRERELLLAVVASGYFLLIGGFVYTNLIPYGIGHLGLDEAQSGYLFVVAAVGIGFGALWAGRLSGRRVEFGIVPIGAIGLTVASAGLGLIPELRVTFFLILVLGVSAGFFIVPIRAFIQLRSPADRRGEILAASAFLGWIGVLVATSLIYCFTAIWGLTAGEVFSVLGVMTLLPTIVTIFLLPDFLVRFLGILITRICYRIDASGLENVPDDRPGLLVSNHVSWVDALIISATQPRRIRFVMEREFYNKRLLKPICKLMKVIPISSADKPKAIINSFREVRKAMDEGILVCIFAEGMMTRSGMMGGFKGGFKHIMKGSSYEIIPVYIGGAWGSIFSYFYGRPLSTVPKKFPYPVSIHFGKAMRGDSSIFQVRQKVSELSCDYFEGLKSPRRLLGYHFFKAARKNWSRHCIADSTGKRLSYGRTLILSAFFSERLAGITEPDEKIGILLPPSAGGAIANLAVTLSARVSVNLNYVLGPEVRASAIEQCQIRYVISSRAFLSKAGISEAGVDFIFLEDMFAEIRWPAKIKGWLKCRFIPMRFLANLWSRSADDLATVIFSSGSSGNPKGVMLSHHNLISNIEALRMVIAVRRWDDLCGVLPFFHSFGFTCALWLPLISGVSVSYIANPLDAELIGRSVRENRSTILFSPPSFFLNYIRRLNREDFSSLRLVASGAEKLKRSLAEAFEDKFGIRPLEGYGATELSPVVSLNIPDVLAGGVSQVGSKDDSVGHPLPGVAVKVVDIETGASLPAGSEGLLLVKGPNVMLGYLNKSQGTAEAVKDSWYNTGDIARIDDEGFISITDRLSRFSKIAGEMVPLVGVEQAYLEGLKTHEQLVAVTSVPDEKKGEELFVFHLPQAGGAERLHEIISKSNLPNIWKPKQSNYIQIASMPVLGSGKLDALKLREIAARKKGLSD